MTCGRNTATQLSWRETLCSAYSRGMGRLRAQLPFSRVICPNSHVLLSHRPWWWGTAAQSLYCRTIWMQRQTLPSNQSQDPLQEGCYAAQGRQQHFALGLEQHPGVQRPQRLPSQSRKRTSAFQRNPRSPAQGWDGGNSVRGTQTFCFNL